MIYLIRFINKEYTKQFFNLYKLSDDLLYTSESLYLKTDKSKKELVDEISNLLNKKGVFYIEDVSNNKSLSPTALSWIAEKDRESIEKLESKQAGDDIENNLKNLLSDLKELNKTLENMESQEDSERSDNE